MDISFKTTASQPEDQAHPWTCLTTTRGHAQPTQGALLEHPAQVTKETAPLGTMRHLLCRATQPRLGGLADLPNLQKQTQRDSQNKETKNYVPNEGT